MLGQGGARTDNNISADGRKRDEQQHCNTYGNVFGELLAMKKKIARRGVEKTGSERGAPVK